jgi:hypothetical protein
VTSNVLHPNANRRFNLCRYCTVVVKAVPNTTRLIEEYDPPLTLTLLEYVKDQ